MEADGQDEYSRATVCFLHGGRAFHFETNVFRDAFDVSAITEAANAALKASRHRERFVVLPDLFGPVLILTDPANFRPVARRFCLLVDAAG